MLIVNIIRQWFVPFCIPQKHENNWIVWDFIFLFNRVRWVVKYHHGYQKSVTFLFENQCTKKCQNFTWVRKKVSNFGYLRWKLNYPTDLTVEPSFLICHKIFGCVNFEKKILFHIKTKIDWNLNIAIITQPRIYFQSGSIIWPIFWSWPYIGQKVPFKIFLFYIFHNLQTLDS